MANERAPGARLSAVLVAAAAATAALGGCATGPAGGTPEAVKGGSSQVQAYVQPLPPPPPGRNWSPTEVVQGFVSAGASYAFDPAAARAYLTPKERAAWQPDQVTVVRVPITPAAPYAPQIHSIQPAVPPSQVKTVSFTGRGLATLNTSGQYLYRPAPGVKFTLDHINGVWLIANLYPANALLLTASDFHYVYQPRNLFFFSKGPGTLVPDPVYAPLQSASSALNTNLATGLVNGLRNDAGSWLSAATTTAFPPKTRLLGQVTISGRTATVNLGGAAATAQPSQVYGMAEQILATLSNTAYSPAVATSVVLKVNGQVRATVQTGQDDPVPGVTAGKAVYFRAAVQTVQAGPSEARRLVPGSRSLPSPAVLPAETDGTPITALAASIAPEQNLMAVATHPGQGCAVYVGPIENPAGRITRYRSYQLSRSGAECTSLSWDVNGNLWAAAGQHIWVLRPQDRQPVAVSLPDTQAIGLPISQVLALRMGPDGVRAALLIKTPDGNRLILAAAAVTDDGKAESFGPAVAAGPGLAPSALSWYNAYNLVVLAGGEVTEVPLTDAPGTWLGPAPLRAQSLSTNGRELAVGTGTQVVTSLASGISWGKPVAGTIPTYSG